MARLPTDVATGHGEPGDEGGGQQANKRRAGERSDGGGTGREYRIVSPDAIMAGGGLWWFGSAEVGAAVEWNRVWDVLDVVVVLDVLVDVERWSVGEAVLSNVMPLMADIHDTEAIHHGSRYQVNGFPTSAFGMWEASLSCRCWLRPLVPHAGPEPLEGEPSPSPTHDRGMSESPMKFPGWLPGHLPPTPAPGAVSPFRSLAWGAPPWQLRQRQALGVACVRGASRSPGLAFFWLFVRPSALAWHLP